VADRSVARRYATAFIELAEEAGKIDALGTQLSDFYGMTQAHEGALFEALSSPVYTSNERGAVLADVLASVKLKGLCANLLRLLIEKGRMDALPYVVEAYQQFADDRAGRVRVQIATAEPLTKALASEVSAALEKTTGKKVILEPSVDPSLIGGIVARVGGTVYDSSIKTRLADLQQALIAHQEPAQA
jgi:F-type H+-transporting ATPase subunit delta